MKLKFTELVHAAVPDAGVDPIVASSQIVMALQTIVSRNISSSHNAVVSVTNIHAGNTWNVIPEKATLEGTIRTFQAETREKIPALMERIIKGVSDALGVKTKFRFIQVLLLFTTIKLLQTYLLKLPQR